MQVVNKMVCSKISNLAMISSTFVNQYIKTFINEEYWLLIFV